MITKISQIARAFGMELWVLLRCSHTPSTLVPSRFNLFILSRLSAVESRHRLLGDSPIFRFLSRGCQSETRDIYRLSARRFRCFTQRILISLVATTIFFTPIIWRRVWFSVWSRDTPSILRSVSRLHYIFLSLLCWLCSATVRHCFQYDGLEERRTRSRGLDSLRTSVML